MPSFMIIASNGEPFMIDWPTMVSLQATILPSRTTPRIRCTPNGR